MGAATMNRGDSQGSQPAVKIKIDPRRDLVRETQVLQLLKSGKKPSEVALLTGYHRNSVLNIRNRAGNDDLSLPRKYVRLRLLNKSQLFEYCDQIWMVTGKYGRPSLDSIEGRAIIELTEEGEFVGKQSSQRASLRFPPELVVKKVGSLIDLLGIKRESEELGKIDKEVEMLLQWDSHAAATG